MIRLIDDRLGTLEIRSKPFVGVGIAVGSRAARDNMRSRALGSGDIDDTRFAGGRAITVTVMLGRLGCTAQDTQALVDRITPYMVARRRPRLQWTLPGSSQVRECVVRGESAPIVVERPNAQVIPLSFVAGDGDITTPQEIPLLIDPASDEEQGLTFDRVYDRTYPASTAVGDRLIEQPGNDDAHWFGTVFCGTTTTLNPSLRVNGATITWTSLVMTPGSYIAINTKEHSMLLNGNPEDSVYHLANFTQWSWSDLLLQPGPNTLRYQAEILGDGSSVQIITKAHWAG